VHSLGYEVTWEGERVDARGEHVLAVTLRDGKRTLQMEPRLMDLPREESKLRKPALGDNGELYLAVIDIARQGGGPEPVWLAKNEEIVIGGVGYTFAGFRMISHENMQVLADIRVRRGERTTMVSPGLSAGPQGTKALDVLDPELGAFSIRRMDADHGRVAVLLPGASPPEVAVVELSTKPFVNLVWIGAVLALLGSVLAGLRRAGERGRATASVAPRRPHPAPAVGGAR
jgi:hypothetical protein